jgi:hypothetical protein
MLHWYFGGHPVIDSIWNLLFRCQHRRTTFPLTPVRKKGDPTPAETYVVCLECGRQFTYDWENMRLGKIADISDGAPAVEPAAPKIPFRTKSKLRYLVWGSAVSAALVLGKVAASRKRSHKPAATGEDHGQDNGSENPKTPGSS